MKIKKLTAGILASVMLIGGTGAFADSVPGKTWDFNGMSSGLPDGFTYNNKSVKTYYETDSDGTGNAFGFAAGVSYGRGNGELKADSNGVSIDASEYTNVSEGTIVMSYDFLVRNDNLNALLIAPVFNDIPDFSQSVQLEQKQIKICDRVIGSIEKDKWYNVAARYNVSEEAVTADVYFGGELKVSGIELSDAYNEGFSEFEILISPLTDENDIGGTFEIRKEIFHMDNLYIGQDTSVLRGEFKLDSVLQASASELAVTFNRAADTASFDKSFVSVYEVTTKPSDNDNTVTEEVLTEKKVDFYSWDDEGKVLTLGFAAEPAINTLLEVVFSPDLVSADGVEYTGDERRRIKIVIPKGVNMFWSFDDGVAPPKYFSYTNKTDLPNNVAQSGAGDSANDKAFCFLVATGVGSMGESTQITKNSNGFKVLSPKYLAAPINDVTIAVNYDFKPMQHYMEGWLVMPGWGTSEYQAKQVSYLRNGTVVFGDEVIGTWNAGKWQNIGVVYHLSSEKGTTIDVWYNGIKKISGFDYSAQKSGICSFVINSIAPHDTSKDTSNRYDGRNEYFIMDNLYIGTDMSCLMDSVVVESSVPEADSEDVSVNTPISVRLNDRAENASAEELISLKSASGETVPLKNFSFDDDRYGISAEYDGILNYRETYTVTLSEAIESQYGYHPVAGAGYSFKTGSAYPGRLTVSNLVKENGTASANVTLSGVEGLLVMASYDDSGAMIEASTAASSGSMSVSCPDGAAVQVFAIDSLASGILIAEPVIENDDASGYYQNNTEITSVEAVGLDKIITISGASSLKNGYVFGKLAKDGKTLSSEAAEDYLGLAAVRTNDKGEFKFTGDVNQTEGTYAYSVRASDMPEAESGSFTYKVKTGKAIESIKLDNTSCDISGSSITMTTSKKDRSGMLVSFTLSEGASLYLGSERLDSGKSRINATNQVTLTVVSEWGEAANYSLDVYTSSGSGGSSGGGSGGGSSSNAKISVSSAALTSPPKLADPIEEVTQIFDDVSRDFWAFEAIENLYAKNIISGVTPTTFEPNREITREELAALLQRAFKLSPKGSRLSFDDVPEDAWYADAVYILADNNIIKGVDTHTFGTGQKITRQDMAVMFYRCAAEKLPEKTREYAEFADDTEIAAYAKDAVKAMYECGIINGMEDNNFQPEGCATRAQAAYILNKISG